MESKDKELNAKKQDALNNKNPVADEEFAEKIYDDNAPTPQKFEDEHDVSSTGQELNK